MTVLDIARSCAVLLQADDLETLLGSSGSDATTETPEDPAADDPEVKTLVKSINLAISEISGDGFPIADRLEATAENGLIPFSAFETPPSAVLSVRYGLAEVEFGVTPFGIKTPHDGAFTVEYSTFPAEAGLRDEITLPPLIGRDELAYLSARNFCLITGRTDEGAIWDQRYAQESEKKRLRRRAKLPARKWR